MAFKRVVQLSIAMQNEDATGASLGVGKPVTQLNNISGLKIKFDVTKTLSKAFNSAKIEITNCSFETKQKWGATGNHITLSVGYEDEGVKSIFLGDISYSLYSKDGPDTMWSIEAYDGAERNIDKYVSLSYAAGSTVQNIVADLISLSNMPVGRMPVTFNGTYPIGWGFAGRVSDGLTEVLAKAGYTYTVTNGQIYIFNFTEITGSIDTAAAIASVQAIQMDKDHGMIGMPEQFLENYEKQGFATTSVQKYKVKSIIFPQASCSGLSGESGTIFQLRSAIKSGFFVAESIHYVGDNWDGDFMMETQLRELPGGH